MPFLLLLLRGFSLGAILSALPQALVLAILPVMGIVFCEHLVTKELRNDQRWFLTRLAQCITPFIPKQGIGLAAFGVITCVFSIVLTRSQLMRTFGFGLLPLGVILVAMGVLDAADKAKAKKNFQG